MTCTNEIHRLCAGKTSVLFPAGMIHRSYPQTGGHSLWVRAVRNLAGEALRLPRRTSRLAERTGTGSAAKPRSATFPVPVDAAVRLAAEGRAQQARRW